MLSRTAGYAVRAVIVLARAYGKRAISADEIASTLGAPRNYLSKTLNALVRRGILKVAGEGQPLPEAAPLELAMRSGIQPLETQPARGLGSGFDGLANGAEPAPIAGGDAGFRQQAMGGGQLNNVGCGLRRRVEMYNGGAKVIVQEMQPSQFILNKRKGQIAGLSRG